MREGANVSEKSAQGPQIPKVSKVAKQIDAPKHFTSRTMLDSVAQAEEPATLTLSAVSTRTLGQISMENQIGTTRPAKIVAGPDEERRNLILIPVHSDTPGGIPVRYQNNSAVFSLYAIYQELDRFVPPDTRQVHAIARTAERVQVGENVGWGMQFRLDEYESKPIKRLSAEERAKRRAKRARQDSAPSHNPEA